MTYRFKDKLMRRITLLSDTRKETFTYATLPITNPTHPELIEPRTPRLEAGD
jgi:hypothetical protein